MDFADDVLRLILAAHTLTRMAALETGSDAPSAQWRTISLLREHGPQRVGDLAARSRVTQPGMTRLVGQLAEAGLVERTTDASDSRATVVGVTPAGERAYTEWLSTLRTALEPRFADLDAEDRAALSRTADILSALTRAPELAR
jgi:DNA-binding MarR family transcriptional regulator